MTYTEREDKMNEYGENKYNVEFDVNTDKISNSIDNWASQLGVSRFKELKKIFENMYQHFKILGQKLGGTYCIF